MANTFDYVIIGAGSAGCVLANRLSANPQNTVLLIEAGDTDKKTEIHIPGGYVKLHGTEVDWGFETEPQTHVLNRKIYLPRGKTLGGSSSTNAMAYVRGNQQDYNDWAALGNKGWSFEQVLPYFKKSESNEDINNQYHSKSGELNVGFPKKFKTPYPEAFIEACKNNGIAHNLDYNGEKQEGAGIFQFTIKNGVRQSAATAFLKPILHRQNLNIATNTATQKILLENKIAKGVQVRNKAGEIQEFKANKEVILSAGSFASPQLLMLSGVGDANELANLNIECKHHLSGVGKNLQDHLFFGVSALSKKQDGQNHHIKLHHQAIDIANYFLRKKGLLNNSPLEAYAFLNILDPTGRVDCQFHFAALHLGEDRKVNPYDIKTLPTTDGFMILPTLLRPKSRGTVSLRSNNANDAPIIQPNFLQHPQDQELMIAAAKKAISIIKDTAFEHLRQRICFAQQFKTDQTILQHIQQWTETVYHPVGTCKMGTNNDPMTVVDETLQVKGIQNLRVIDASIMPTIVSGNTNAPVFMIAEKGADMILEKNILS